MSGEPQQHAGAAATVEAELVAIATAWAAAIVSNDVARIAAFMAEEWVIVSESGIGTREQFLSLVASGELTHTAMDLVSDLRVRIYGETAVITGRITNTAHYAEHCFEADEWTTDVFVKQQDRWRCVLSQITPAEPA